MAEDDNKTTLAQLAPGEQATLVELQTDSPGYRQSLYAMGLLPGTPIKIIRLAPLGDPMQVEVRGSQLAIRKRDAQGLIVQRGGGKDD
jgi:ferrous iron transport protein A